MEVLVHHEVWTDTEDDLVYDHIEVLLRQGSRYYIGSQKDRHAPIQPENITIVAELPDSYIYAPFPAGLTLAPDPLPENVYLKRPDILASYGATDNCCTILIQEAHLYEKLRLHPHKNIVKYHGCMEEKGMFHAICLEKYPVTLAERVNDLSEAEKKRAFQDIQDGIAHLHSIGFAHNDLNPTNVMIAEDGTAVIVDFDSCSPIGELMGPKGPTMGWGGPQPGEPGWGAPPGERQLTTTEGDLRNLKQMKEYLLGKVVA
ncbi:kinase-like domain-containing protein [Nemania sp. NC0429]|nr:kinase-like domain-containing protein [Nemania sp. NC0429]